MKITVVTANLEKIKAAIEKLVKRANKLGVEAPVATYSEERFVKEPDGHYLSLTDVEVTNPIVKLADDWQLVATIERYEAGNMINAVPSLSDRLPTSLRTEPLAICDHCQFHRKRNKYIAVTNEAKELKYVGTTCVKDFLGHDAMRSVSYYSSIINTFKEFDEYKEGGDYTGLYQARLREIIEVTLAVLEQSTWVSARGGSERDLPTYFEVNLQIFNHEKLKPTERVEVLPKHTKLAQTISDRWQAISDNIDPDDSSDFDFKKHLLINEELTRVKDFALAVGLTYGETIAIAKELEQGNKPTAFFGTEGERDCFVVKITQVKTIETKWGRSHLVKGWDVHSEGEFVWFDSSQKDWYEIGFFYRIEATVKRHDRHRTFGNQTILTRLAAC